VQLVIPPSPCVSLHWNAIPKAVTHFTLAFVEGKEKTKKKKERKKNKIKPNKFNEASSTFLSLGPLGSLFLLHCRMLPEILCLYSTLKVPTSLLSLRNIILSSLFVETSGHLLNRVFSNWVDFVSHGLSSWQPK
jgi:hypothetical protein